MFNTAGVERRGSTDNTVDFITLLQQELNQVGTVLTGNTYTLTLSVTKPLFLCTNDLRHLI